MKVTITFLGPLRDRVGSKSLTAELPDKAVYRDLLDSIAPTMQQKLPDWAWDSAKGSFSRQMMVTRNLSADLRDETTDLADGDEIHVLLPLAGG